MTGPAISPDEKNQWRVVNAIRQLGQGRTDANGVVTLAASVTATVVPAPNCAASSGVFLFPATANAAAAVPTTYVLEANVIKGQFTITHTSAASVDRTFYYVTLG